MMDKKRNIKRDMGIVMCLAFVILLGYFAIMSYADEESYTGIFITANKVYMPDNTIKLVIYFNESDGNIHFKIFDNWDARHSVLLSNMETGTTIKIIYKDFVFRDCREIVRVEKL